MPDTFKSQYKLFPPSLPLIITGLTAFLALIATFLLVNSLGSGNGNSRVAIASAAYFMVWLFFLRQVWRECPVVWMDREGMQLKTWFGKAAFTWEEIKAIRMFEGRVGSLVLFAGQASPLITIELSNGRLISLPVDVYQNNAALGQILDQVQKLLLARSPVGFSLQFTPAYLPESEENPDDTAYQTFTGNFWLSGRGIAFVVFTAQAIYYSFQQQPAALSDIIPGVAFLFIAWLIGRELYFFKMSDRHLVVRHHLFWWYKKAIPLADIQRFDFYNPSRRAEGLRVILQDFKIYDFPAGTLRGKHWKALRAAFNQKGIAG